eukprot:TRINITY_DN4214_c1_g1_i1.p1 TRINITY_DN4214_c1_g1~~TRINITY_DN4214_c1_g1_i1.p1  ORF type:complete len:313 (-),score=88.79 TRINITY_DN4214_c1_g1_i1:221-1159(-)
MSNSNSNNSDNNNNKDTTMAPVLWDCRINQLPDSILLNVFSFLDEESFLKTLMVCKKWNELVQKNIVFFEEWFAEKDQNDDDDGDDEEPIEEDHQRVLIEQIVKCEERNYCHLFGIDATDDRQLSDEMEKEARTQYRRLSLMIHPDRCKLPDATKAFQILKKAIELTLTPRDAVEMPCPDTENCGEKVKLSATHANRIEKGIDQGKCTKCQRLFGRIYCSHCFSNWLVILELANEGSFVPCPTCYQLFRLNFPKAYQPPPPTKRPLATTTTTPSNATNSLYREAQKVLKKSKKTSTSAWETTLRKDKKRKVK